MLDFYIWTLVCFCRERRSREGESQRNGRRVLGHGLNRDPSVPEGHPGIFPSSKTWVSARLAESHFNHPVSGSGPPCTNRTLPHLYGHRFADAHFTRCRSWPSGQPFFHDYLCTAQLGLLFLIIWVLYNHYGCFWKILPEKNLRQMSTLGSNK